MLFDRDDRMGVWTSALAHAEAIRRTFPHGVDAPVALVEAGVAPVHALVLHHQAVEVVPRLEYGSRRAKLGVPDGVQHVAVAFENVARAVPDGQTDLQCASGSPQLNCVRHIVSG